MKNIRFAAALLLSLPAFADDLMLPELTPPDWMKDRVPASANRSPAEESAPFPLNFTYIVEYLGPRLSNIDLGTTQGPASPAPAFTGIDHDFRVSHKVTSVNAIGIRIRANSPFDLDREFSWANLRFYGTWSHMIETADVDMGAKLEWEPSTTDGSRNAGQLARFNFSTNWVLKTAARNWSFSGLLWMSPRFYESNVDKTDLVIAFGPSIATDIAPNLQLQFDGWFDASHSTRETFFDFSESDHDYFNSGVVWAINGNVQVNPAIRFYTGNLSFKAAVLYANASVSF